MGYKIDLYNDNGREINFRCEKDGKIYFIQVANSVASKKAYEREFSAFDKLDNRNKKNPNNNRFNRLFNIKRPAYEIARLSIKR